MKTYTFKIAPTYTIATYTNGSHTTTLDEWRGRSVEDFAAGMAGRGFSHSVDEYDLSSGHFVEHTWTK